MKHLLVLLILCAACTRQKASVVSLATPTATPVQKGSVDPAVKNQHRELQKISKWFEQMDAILRESLWVVRKDRPPQGKSIFGKMQRAALVEMNEKLANKSMFRCDSYSMTRRIGGVDGVPQSAEVLHRCGSKENFVKIGDWSHPNKNTLIVNFRGGNLEEVLGMATGILSPQINCELKSNEGGTIESLVCKGLMIDYNSKKSQVLRFNRFEYFKGEKNVLHLRADILENLEAVRKIEADVPLEGAILVTETVLQAPMVEAKQVPPSPTPSPSPATKKQAKENPHGQNPQEEQQQPILEGQNPGEGAPQNPEEGQADSGEIIDQNQNQNPNRGSIKAVEPEAEQDGSKHLPLRPPDGENTR